MPTIDVTDAAQRLLENKTVTPGHCLEYVSRAIRNGRQPLIWSGLDTALNCWNLACGDKQTSRNIPRGFPGFLGANRFSKAGDTFISLGDGRLAVTDYPTWGVVGICTLEQREAQTGRRYLGYAGEFLGYTLTSTGTASLDLTPINEEEEMTPDQATKLEAVYQALWNGGSNTVDGQVQKYNYGVLPIIVNNQNLIARVITEQSALSAAVNAISTGNVDVAAVTAAARAGAEAALADLHIPTSGTITLQ